MNFTHRQTATHTGPAPNNMVGKRHWEKRGEVTRAKILHLLHSVDTCIENLLSGPTSTPCIPSQKVLDYLWALGGFQNEAF